MATIDSYTSIITMSRWDQPAPSTSTSPQATAEEQADVSDAIAMAAKIAASLRPGAQGLELVRLNRNEPEGDFVKDIEVNDLRNRYVLTKDTTQKEVGPVSVLQASGTWR